MHDQTNVGLKCMIGAQLCGKDSLRLPTLAPVLTSVPAPVPAQGRVETYSRAHRDGRRDGHRQHGEQEVLPTGGHQVRRQCGNVARQRRWLLLLLLLQLLCLQQGRRACWRLSGSLTASFAVEMNCILQHAGRRTPRCKSRAREDCSDTRRASRGGLSMRKLCRHISNGSPDAHCSRRAPRRVEDRSPTVFGAAVPSRRTPAAGAPAPP